MTNTSCIVGANKKEKIRQWHHKELRQLWVALADHKRGDTPTGQKCLNLCIVEQYHHVIYRLMCNFIQNATKQTVLQYLYSIKC